MNVNFMPIIRLMLYYLNMKKLLLLVTIFILTAQAGFCANTSPEKKNASRMLMKSNALQHSTSVKISNNFHFDHHFANYMKYRGLMFESDRQRLIASVFTTSSGANTNREAISEFIIKLNNIEINNYKTIVQEYCKYNAFKFKEKDPTACSQERINSLF